MTEPSYNHSNRHHHCGDQSTTQQWTVNNICTNYHFNTLILWITGEFQQKNEYSTGRALFVVKELKLYMAQWATDN